jgi:hypothetical protein
VVAFGSRWAAYIVDFDINTTVKQLAGGRISPIFKLGTEIYFGQMPKYTCHGNITRSPWRAEIESEVIVLGILGAGDISLPGIISIGHRESVLYASLDSVLLSQKNLRQDVLRLPSRY